MRLAIPQHPMHDFIVRLIIDSGGDPESDEVIVKVVSAQDKHAAVEVARRLVRHEEAEKAARIWAWSVTRSRR